MKGVLTYGGIHANMPSPGAASQSAFKAWLTQQVFPELCDTRRDSSCFKLLVIPPDYTRKASMSGIILHWLYEWMVKAFAKPSKPASKRFELHVLPALGTHHPMTDLEIADMFGGIHNGKEVTFLEHHYLTKVRHLGTMDLPVLETLSAGLISGRVSIALSQYLLDPYDRILSLGQVLPHEILGMANYTKNIVIGLGGKELIDKTHFLAALLGMENLIAKRDNVIRTFIDAVYEEFVAPRTQVRFLHTVLAPASTVDQLLTAPKQTEQTSAQRKQSKPSKPSKPSNQSKQQAEQIPPERENQQPRQQHKGNLEEPSILVGTSYGSERSVFDWAGALSERVNITLLPYPLDEVWGEFPSAGYTSTWITNKAIYRLRLIMRQGGNLTILAPGVRRFGENSHFNAIIEKYGFRPKAEIIRLMETDLVLREELSVAIHLIYGSSNNDFTITYAVDPSLMPLEKVRKVGYEALAFEDAISRRAEHFSTLSHQLSKTLKTLRASGNDGAQGISKDISDNQQPQLGKGADTSISPHILSVSNPALGFWSIKP